MLIVKYGIVKYIENSKNHRNFRVYFSFCQFYYTTLTKNANAKDRMVVLISSLVSADRLSHFLLRGDNCEEDVGMTSSAPLRSAELSFSGLISLIGRLK